MRGPQIPHQAVEHGAVVQRDAEVGGATLGGGLGLQIDLVERGEEVQAYPQEVVAVEHLHRAPWASHRHEAAREQHALQALALVAVGAHEQLAAMLAATAVAQLHGHLGLGDDQRVGAHGWLLVDDDAEFWGSRVHTATMK